MNRRSSSSPGRFIAVGLVAWSAVACSSGSSDGGGRSTTRPSQAPVVAASMSAPSKATHPLDSLSAGELEVFRSVMVSSGHFDGVVFPYIGLAEPDKVAVLAAKPGDAGVRRALAVARQEGITAVALVDLTARRLVSWTPQPGAQAGFTSDDFTNAVAAVRTSSAMEAALAKRGLVAADVYFVTFAGGSTSSPAEQGRRLARVVPYRTAGTGDLMSRPIEGIVATVDIDRGEVLSVADSGVVPAPAEAPAPLRSRPPLESGGFTVPKASSLRVDGAAIAWAGWSLRWDGDRRAGIGLHDVSFDAGSGARRVLYRAGVGDLFVPYQDPSPAWAERTLLDSAEFGLGTTLTSLQPGIDCPTEARFVDVVVPDDIGRAQLKTAALCVFERPTGNPAYRHQSSGRLATELVIRSIPTIGNYDYVIDYVLSPDGGMRFHVFAAGVVLQKGVDAVDASDAHAKGLDEHGVLIGNHLLAVNHDHFVSFRLDLDVGATDRLVRQEMVPETVTGGSDRTVIWKVQDRVITGTKDAAYTPDPLRPTRVLIRSSAADGPLGHHPSYEIDFGDSAAVAPPAAENDPGSRRGGWAGQSLWVTPFDVDQRFASGLFVPDGSAPAGLSAWAAQDAPIIDRDLVAWVTVGFHHIVRTEDLPQMPAHEGGFAIRPVDVYSSNPWLALGF